MEVKSIFYIYNSGSERKDENDKKKSQLFNSSFAIEEKSFSKGIDKNQINIVLVGDCDTGKSSFVIKCVQNKFENFYVTSIRTEVDSKKMLFNDREFKLNFIVISGKPEYKEDFTKSFQIDFFLFFYDITNRKTFENLKEKIKEIKNFIFLYPNKCANTFIIGNKCESAKNRQVSVLEVENFCKERKLEFLEISIKNNLNTVKLMNKILQTYDNLVEKFS